MSRMRQSFFLYTFNNITIILVFNKPSTNELIEIFYKEIIYVFDGVSLED